MFFPIHAIRYSLLRQDVNKESQKLKQRPVHQEEERITQELKNTIYCDLRLHCYN